MVPTLMEPTLMVPTLTVHTLTVPTLMVHLVAPNVLLNLKKDIHGMTRIRTRIDRVGSLLLNLCTFIYFWGLIASRNVDKCPGWNHETAIRMAV